MAIFKKKGASSAGEQGNNPDPAMFAGASIWEKLEKERKAARSHIIFFAILFAVLFGWMCFYFTQTAIEDRVELFDNDYNHRDELLATRNRRGGIYASDSETLLASTRTDVDEEGNVVQIRSYPFGSMYAHVVGYAQLGGSGLEEHFKYELLHSDLPLSEKVRYDNQEEPEDKLYPGNNLITTLDPDIQEACYEAMGNYEGAVIVTEVKTGRILAMVSKPDYDPNYIEEEWEKLLEDNESGTLLNRVTQGLYPPGSTFKIVDCIDLLQEDPAAMENYSFKCTGVFEQGGESIHCYEYEVHGEVGLEESFAHSCNASFANIGVNMISADTMSATLKSLLFNSKLPYDLPYIRSAVNMPNTLSTEGIMQMAIGQGTTSMTPLHLNMITSAVANGGVLMKPHLVDELHDAKGRTLKVYGNEQYGALMSEDVASKMVQMMRAVVTEGTANSLSGREYEPCGKTGSAEFDNNKSSHAWFTGFAPASDPQICVTVLIEGKGMGSSYAVPVAGRIFDAYFE